MIAKSALVKRYGQRIVQFKQNRLFEIDQKRFYMELIGKDYKLGGVTNAEQSRKPWGDIWSVAEKHEKDAEWLNELKNKNIHEQGRVVITKGKVLKQCRKISNWNGLDTYVTGLLAKENDKSVRQNCHLAE